MGLFFARPPKVYPFYSYSTQQQLTEFANLPTHITNSPCVFLDPFHSLHITASHCTTQSPSQTFPNNWHAANSILQTTLFTSPPPTTAYSQLQYCTQPQHTDLLWDWHLLPWTLLRHSYHRQSSQHIDQMNPSDLKPGKQNCFSFSIDSVEFILKKIFRLYVCLVVD